MDLRSKTTRNPRLFPLRSDRMLPIRCPAVHNSTPTAATATVHVSVTTKNKGFGKHVQHDQETPSSYYPDLATAPEPADTSPWAPAETIAARSISASASDTAPPLSGGGTNSSAPERNAAVGTEAMWPKRACLSSEVRSALNMSSSPSWNSGAGVWERWGRVKISSF